MKTLKKIVCVCMAFAIVFALFPVAPAKAGEGDMTPVYRTEGRLAPDMPEWIFEIYEVSGSEYTSMALIIEDKDGNNVYVGPLKEIYGDMGDAHVILVDANFDGHKDVLYTEGPTGTREYYWYHLLLWNGKTKTLVPSESFNEICNPVVDARDKVIRSCSGSADEFEYSIYRHRGGEFYHDMKIIQTTEEINGKEANTYQIYNYKNGVAERGSTFETIEPLDPNHPDEKEICGPDSIWKLDDPIWYEGRFFTGP